MLPRSPKRWAYPRRTSLLTCASSMTVATSIAATNGLDRRHEWKQVFYSLRLPQVQEFLELASELAGNSPTSFPIVSP